MWNKEGEAFKRQTALEDGYEIEDIQNNYSQGLTRLEREDKRVYYGENSIEIKVKSYMVLFIEEVLNPFYVFQIFANDLETEFGNVFTIIYQTLVQGLLSFIKFVSSILNTLFWLYVQ